MSDLRSPEEWGDAYVEQERTYAAFVERLEELLRNLLQDEDLRYVESAWSTMDSESLVTGIYVRGREGTRVDDVFESFGDLGAVTIVTRTHSETEPVCTLVEREFDVDVDSSFSFEAARASNADMAQGGYTGRVFYDYPRLVVSLTAERSQLPEWSRFHGMRAEIRVLTLLHRAWQEIDLKILPYNWDPSYPPGVEELIVRAATQIARADDDLDRISGATDEIEEAYALAHDRGELDGGLDVSALYVYVRDSESVTELVEAAEKAGMKHDPDRPYVSEANLWLARRLGFQTVGEIDAFLRESATRALDVFGSLVHLVRTEEEDFVPWAARESVYEWLLLVLTRADAETVSLTRYRPSIEAALNTLIGNRVER